MVKSFTLFLLLKEHIKNLIAPIFAITYVSCHAADKYLFYVQASCQ